MKINFNIKKFIILNALKTTSLLLSSFMDYSKQAADLFGFGILRDMILFLHQLSLPLPTTSFLVFLDFQGF